MRSEKRKYLTLWKKWLSFRCHQINAQAGFFVE